MHAPVIEFHVSGFITPGQGVLHPVLIVPFREVFAGMSTAAFFTSHRAIHGDGRLADQIVQLQRFHEIRIPGHGPV